MNRKKFLRDLERLWKYDKTTKFDLCLEDLLDDCATLGLPGAALMYVHMITKALDRSRN